MASDPKAKLTELLKELFNVEEPVRLLEELFAKYQPHVVAQAILKLYAKYSLNPQAWKENNYTISYLQGTIENIHAKTVILQTDVKGYYLDPSKPAPRKWWQNITLRKD